MKGTTLDRERDKFRPALGELSKVAVVFEQESPIPITEGIVWDEIQASYPSPTVEVYDYFLSMTAIQKITITYETASKSRILSVEKVIL